MVFILSSFEKKDDLKFLCFKLVGGKRHFKAMNGDVFLNQKVYYYKIKDPFLPTKGLFFQTIIFFFALF